MSERMTPEREADARELRRDALPTNCTLCNGRGSEPPHGPEDGPCQRCGGWTAHKRMVAAEPDALRKRVADLEAQLAAVGATSAPLYTSQERVALLQRADAAEAQLAALRIEMECLADSVARERLTHDGDLADIPGPGALERLGAAERMARAALSDAAATAEAYTRRVRAQALREVLAEAESAALAALDRKDGGE